MQDYCYECEKGKVVGSVGVILSYCLFSLLSYAHAHAHAHAFALTLLLFPSATL